MQKLFAYLLLSALAVVGACASTTQMEPDGQTHWMTRCDENADCGELSCICGVCTELCTASDECSTGESAEASCQTTANVLDTTECTTPQAAASVCVPLCEGQSDCSGVASELMCLNSGVCAIDDLPINEEDGSVPDPNDNDASVEEREPPVTGPITPIELACDEDGNLAGEGPFEILVSGEVSDSLAIAANGTVFATGTLDSVSNSAFRVTDGEIDPFGMELWDIQRMVIAGSDMIAAMSNGHDITIVATDVETQARRVIAREEVVNALALTADEQAVYWISNIAETPDLYQLWRSPRVPGESMVLAEVDSVAWDSLVVLNDDLFFLGIDGGDLELLRVAKDGSDGGALTALQVPANASDLRTDGQNLFYSLITEQDGLGNPIPGERGIVRMDGVTLQTETLFDTGEDQPWDVIFGGPYVYWTTDHTVRDFEPLIRLWRGASNGSGAPEQLGTLDAYVSSLAEHNGELYWVSTCRIGNDGTTKSHIVKMTD